MKIDLGEALLSIITAVAAVALFAMSAQPVESEPQPIPAFIWAGE